MFGNSNPTYCSHKGIYERLNHMTYTRVLRRYGDTSEHLEISFFENENNRITETFRYVDGKNIYTMGKCLLKYHQTKIGEYFEYHLYAQFYCKSNFR